MTLRPTILLCAALAACTHPAAPAVTPVAVPTGPSADAAVVADASAARDAPDDALCAADDEACDNADNERLTRAFELVTTDVAGARQALISGRSRRSVAWRSYLALHAHDDAEADRLRAQLVSVGIDTSTGPDTAPLPPGAQALFLVRQATDASIADRDALAGFPCVVFAWEEIGGLRAFGAMHGSSLDNIAGGIKSRCAEQSLDVALPEADRAAAHRVVSATLADLFRLFPRPDGTMWTAPAVDAASRLTDVFLVTTYVPPHGDERELPGLLRGRPNRAALSAAVGQYLRALTPRLAPLASAWAAVARHQGQTVDDAVAHSRVRTAAVSALYLWLSALTQAQ